ncbi:uncharacterized protein [Ambystoma mexicanum]|uniref:uncharacterized protein n=1 Tax=Ambystoma mexicanum TaxID=8296 RepID=UPI0037E7E899
MSATQQVILVGLTGTPHTIDVATSEEVFKSTTIKRFKELVANKIEKEAHIKNLGIDDIRLVFGSKQLEETETFDHYGIIAKSTIFMVLKLPGGWC